jgi:hypothetical protein
MNQFDRNSHSYYSTVSTLTPKDAQAVSVEEEVPAVTTSETSLTLLTAPLLIFIGLFIMAIVVQLVQKVLTLKRLMGALAVSLIIAASPFVSSLISERSNNPYLRADNSITPKDLEITVTRESAEVRWKTGKPVTGAVRLISIPVDISITVIGNDGVSVTGHSVILPVNIPGTYFLEILSGDEWYNDHGHPLRIVIPPPKS